jgi:hypothetical protein
MSATSPGIALEEVQEQEDATNELLPGSQIEEEQDHKDEEEQDQGTVSHSMVLLGEHKTAKMSIFYDAELVARNAIDSCFGTFPSVLWTCAYLLSHNEIVQ